MSKSRRSPEGSKGEEKGTERAPNAQERMGNAFLQRQAAALLKPEEDLGGDRLSFAARTYCDLDHRQWSSTSQMLLAQREDLPTKDLGSGQVLVEPLGPYATLGKGLKELVDLHEGVHVANAQPYARGFKSDIDEDSSPWLLGMGGDEYISSNDYIQAFNDNGGGLAPCSKDEKAAYAAMVKRAKEMLEDPAFSEERASIRANLPGWEAQAASPETCG